MASTAGFPDSGTFQVLNSNDQLQTVTYASKTATTFRGCSGGTGTIKSGTSVTGGSLLGDYFGGLGWPSYINPSQADLKIPAGSNLFQNSPFNGSTSSYTTYGPSNQWLLTSGGTTPLNANDGLGNPGGIYSFQTMDGMAVFGGKAGPDQISFGSMQQRQEFFDNLRLMMQSGQPVYFQAAGNGPILGTLTSYVESSDWSTSNQDDSFTIALNGTMGPPNNQGITFNFTRATTDYAATAIANLWYSWAQYYVKQEANTGATAQGTITPGSNVLTLTSTPTSPLVVGMTVSAGSGIANGTSLTGPLATTILGLGTVRTLLPDLPPIRSS